MSASLAEGRDENITGAADHVGLSGETLGWSDETRAFTTRTTLSQVGDGIDGR
jgi:hypothetical protein